MLVLMVSSLLGGHHHNFNNVVAKEMSYFEIREELALQQPALDAYEILSSIFTRNKDGTISYPHDYGGVWIYDFKLHIALTAEGKDNIDFYSDLLSNFEPHIVFVEVDYSLNLLNEIRNTVAPFIYDSLGLHSHHVNIRLNSISFEIPEESYAEINRMVEEETNRYEDELGGTELLKTYFHELDYHYIEEILNIQEHEIHDFSGVDVLTALFLEPEHSNIVDLLKDQNNEFNSSGGLALLPELFVFTEGEEKVVPTSVQLRGGMQFQVGGIFSNNRFTIGVCGLITSANGTITNNRAFVTVAHGNAISGTNQVLFRNLAELGRVNVRSLGSNGDWALVRLTNNDIVTNRIFGSSTSATRNIVGSMGDAPEGTAIMMFGQRSGFARARVTAQNVNPPLMPSSGLTRATITQGTVDVGDSGGPVYVQAPQGGNNYHFIGIIAGSSVPEGGNAMVFTPYRRFSHRFIVRTW